MKVKHYCFLACLLASNFVAAVHGSEERQIDIDTAFFDTSTHKFSVSWHLNMTNVPAGEVAMIALCGSETLPSTAPDNNQFPITALSGDTSFDIKPLLFDTTYRVGIWLHFQGSWIAPDSESLYSVKVPKATWEPVRMFSGSVKDTVFIFNKKVRLWCDTLFTTVHHDTVKLYTPVASKLKGFRPGATCLNFSSRDSLPQPFFSIGFHIDSLYQDGRPFRIFRDSSGCLFAEHGTVYDSSRHILYTKTNRIDLPFLLLSDTVAPKIELVSDTSRDIGSKTIDCIFNLSDNTYNCNWQLFSGSAGDAPLSGKPSFSGTLHSTAKKCTCQVSTSSAQEAGLRMYLVINDGTNTDTINVSHTVRRPRSNEMTTTAGMIMPVATNSVLDSASCRQALRTLFSKAGGNYDAADFRIYRWQKTPGSNTGNGWLEYSQAKKDEFDFLPGRLFWLITRNEAVIDFGAGNSPSLKDTVKISLPPGEWTDFSSPYSFPVAFSELLAATDTAASHLHFYQWEKNESRHTWRAEALFCADVPGLDTPSTLLPNTDGYFTVYNPSDTEIILNIPPVSANSTSGAAKTAMRHYRNGEWSVRFDITQGNSVTGSVICAASLSLGKPISVPPAPAFSGSSITLRLPGEKRTAGTLILPANTTQYQAFELTVTNSDASPATITCNPTIIAGTTEGPVSIDTSIKPLFTAFSMTIDAHKSQTVLCKVGDQSGGGWSAVQNVPDTRIVSLSSINSGSAISVRIVSAAGQNSIELFDLNGRRCGISNCSPGNNANEFTATIRSGGNARGCYLVHLTSISNDGTMKHHVQKMMLLQ